MEKTIRTVANRIREEYLKIFGALSEENAMRLARAAIKAMPKRPSGKEIHGAGRPYLDRELNRCKQALRNKALRPQSQMYYSKRVAMVEAEIGRQT